MQPTMMLPKLTDTTQTISFSEDDDVCSAEVYANNVVVTTSAGNHNHGSSKVKLKNLVDYNWEPKFYPGQLLAIHMSGQYLAYSIKAPNALNPGTWSGMVRVVYSPEPGGDRRTLIKGMRGEVQDLAFSYIQNRVVLACIDEQGNYYVHEITTTDTGLRCTALAEVHEDTGAGAEGGSHRVVWCPYIPDEEDDAADDDVAWMLLTTHNNIARIWYVNTVQSRLEHLNAVERCAAVSQLLAGAEAEEKAGAVAGGVAAGEHAAPIVHAAFSPDGTALATASTDGYVMFFQVYAQSSSAPRCLHKWQPHGGKPLSCLFFLDDHKNYNTDVQFWKFAVTGAESNTCIKIWSCKSWSCLQTITFAASPASGPAPAPAYPLGFKAMLDSSARYLVVSGGRARSLYVLRVARDAADCAASCTALAEFLLPYPVLSFCILAAEEEEVRCDSGLDEPYLSDGDRPASPPELDPLRDELDRDSARGSACGAAGGRARVRLRLYIVHPKGLQEGELVYAQPPPAPAPRTPPALPAPHTPPAPHHGVPEPELELALDQQEAGASAGAGVGGSAVAGDSSPPTYEALLEQQSEQLKSLLMRSQPSMLVAPTPGAGDAPPAAGAAGGAPPPPLTLMTPDAFSSAVPLETEEPLSLAAKPELSQGALRSNTAASGEGNGAAGESAEGVLQPSGGSSPSREVQQIMAHDAPYYKQHMDDDDEEDEEDDDGEGERREECAGEGHEVAPRVNGAPPPLNHSNSESSWPLIAAAQIAEAHRKAASERAASRCHSMTNSLHAPAPAPAPGAAEHEALRARLLQAEAEARELREQLRAQDRLARLDGRLDGLAEAVGTCLHEVRSLRGALGSQRDATEQALRTNAQRTAQTVEDAINAGWERVGRVGEVAAARAGTAAGTGAARALEPLAAALQHELAAKLTATDHLLRENIEKLATSKTVLECLSATVGGALADMVRRTFRDALLDNVMPVMEKALAQMFHQLNATFQSGTKESNAESAARAAVERGSAAQLESLLAALERHEATLERHNAALQAYAHRAHCASTAQAAQPDFQLHVATFMHMTHNLMEKEMVWWREHLMQVVSRAQTPALPAPGPAPAPGAAALDRQKPHRNIARNCVQESLPYLLQIQVGQVQSLIARGEVNAGFQMALSAADLALVVTACRSADPARVFRPPCALKQNVLMSLVQQLGADMATDTDLKHKYLEEALLNLDLTDPVTRQHMPSIIRELQKQIAAYLSTNPDQVRARQFRMLAMVGDSLMHQI